MKKNLLYVIGFFVLMTVGLGIFNMPETKKAPTGETYTVTTKKKEDVALSNFMQQYRDGIFETVRLVDNNRLEGLIVVSQKTGTVAGTSVVLSKEYNKLITDIPFETKFTDLGIVTSGSTTVEVDNNTQNPYVSFAVENILPIVLFVLVLMFIMKQLGGKGGMGGLPIKFSVGRQKDPNDGSKKTTFADVAGMEEVKNEVQEIVDFLKTPEKYIKVGARIPKGVLLYGQPGTGKTLLARAVAGEAGVPFISASGSEFMEMLVGMGAAKVRELFTKAKAQAPAIIFIDEIDAIGKKRGGGMTGGHQEQEQTLNQILTEMDGFEQDTKIIVMASTNRPDTLDPALMRSGRFDRKVLVTLPTVEERTQIINYYLKDKKVAEDINIDSLARRMSGFAGADIETIINEAALRQAKEDRDMLTREDLDYGLEKVVMGPEKKSRRLSEHEREVVIYHELGHAVTAYNLKNCDPVEKISIVSRGQALGVTWMMPDEDKNLYSKQKFLDECVSLLGGRAAEEIFFGVENITTGASNDLERVTAHLYRMLTKYGMDEELGTLVYETDENSLTKPYSEQTAQMIDMKLRSLVHELYAQSKKLIADNKDLMIVLGKILDKREYIHKEEFAELMAAGADLEAVAERIKGSNL